MSPFATTAARYRDMGLAIMPCGPGTKFPGSYSAADGWRTAWDWQKYCERLPSEYEITIWDRWPDAGICLALGQSSAPKGLQLIAVDIDTEDEAQVAAIRAVLPGSPVRKRGAKGETEFYLAPLSVPNRPYNDSNKRRMLDLLGHGRQTVCPPSVHPDCQHCGAKGTVATADMSCRECGAIGQAYRWTTLDTLETFDVADLPVLPDDIADILGAALAPFGHVDPVALVAGEVGDGEASTHRQLNDAALANLPAWVPGLNLFKCRQVGDKYKAVADWRPSASGRPSSARATNLAIAPDGIKDCGEGKGYTPLDLVMAACGTDLEGAFRWLQERVAPQKAVVLKAREATRVGNLSALRLATFEGVAVQPATCNDCLQVAATLPASGIIPPALCRPPGLVGDIVEWIDDSDEGDAPQLALGATLAFLGAIMGRRYAHPSRGARTNVYCMGVGPTGYGKAHSMLAIKELARRSGVDGFLGPGRWKSESAVRKIVEAKPTVCCLVDELGGVMRDILGKKASEHKAGVRDILLELFSSANTTYTGAEGASERAVPIVNPNLAIYGAGTPSDLWGNFSSSAAADGFLPRWLVFDVGERRPARKEARQNVFNPPEILRQAIHAILDVRPAGNLSGITAPTAIDAAWGDGAKDFFRAMQDASDDDADAARAKGDESTVIILSRAVEHAAKLSLIYAVSINAIAPVITVAALQWARDVVACSTTALIRGIDGKVADSDAQAQYLWVLAEIRKAGADGVAEAALMKRVHGRWDVRRHGDILGQLQAGGVIWRMTKTTGAGGRPSPRVGMWAEGEREAG